MTVKYRPNTPAWRAITRLHLALELSAQTCADYTGTQPAEGRAHYSSGCGYMAVRCCAVRGVWGPGFLAILTPFAMKLFHEIFTVDGCFDKECSGKKQACYNP